MDPFPTKSFKAAMPAVSDDCRTQSSPFEKGELAAKLTEGIDRADHLIGRSPALILPL